MPAGRDESRCQIGERSEHEEAVPSLRMWHFEQLCVPLGLERGAERLPFQRSFDRDARSPEDQEVKVELAGTPSRAAAAAEAPLEVLEGDEQVDRADFRARSTVDVEGHHRIPEVRLIDDAYRPRRVHRRDADETGAGQLRQRHDRGSDRGLAVAHVGSQADVRPDPTCHSVRLLRPRR